MPKSVKLPIAIGIPFSIFIISSLYLVSGISGLAFADGSLDTRVQMNVDTVINISSPGVTTINCGSFDQLCTTTANVNVSTNNATGYVLQMNTTSGYSNALTNAAFSSNIPTLTTAYTSNNFPVNYWGYTGGTDKSSETGGYDCATNYCPILAYNSDPSSYAPNHVIKETNAPVSVTNNSDPGSNPNSSSSNLTTAITFGTKVDPTKPSGTYNTSITFTAVANYVTTPITNGMFLQDIDTKVCKDTPLYSQSNTIYTVIDSRDRTEYTVAKLADGNCWMTQNLELGEYGKPMNLTSDTSNVSSDGYTLDFSYANNSIYKGNSNHYGNYYNWSQATAGSGTGVAGEDAPYSVCPKNWRLPQTTTIVTNSEYYTLLNQNYITTGEWKEATESSSAHWEGVTISQFTNAPVSLVFSGLINGTLYDQGSVGYWWSSSSSSSSLSNAFNLRASTNGYVYPREYYNRSYGFSVRCLVPGS